MKTTPKPLPKARPCHRVLTLPAITLLLLFAGSESTASAAPVSISLQPGGPAKLLRIPLEELPAPGEIRVLVTPPIPRTTGIDIRVVHHDGGTLIPIQAFTVEDRAELYALFTAERGTPDGTLEGTIEFRQEGRAVGHAAWQLQVRGDLETSVLGWAGGGVLAVSIFLVAGMILNVRLLPSPARLLRHLEPQLLEPDRPDPMRRLQLSSELRRALSPGRRWTNWWKSNPLRFALPGRLYREALALRPLVGGGGFESLLIEDPNLPRRLDEPRWQGRLYAVATPWRGVEMYAVPDRWNRIGQLKVGDPIPANHRLRRQLQLRQGEEPAARQDHPRLGLRVRV